uniref:Uncharacterized protein n=1 Tax=Romanomermis culicivorax TaxID=13658 RepID=A0A915J6P4_ROMCU
MIAISAESTPSPNVKSQDQLNELNAKYNSSSKRKVALKEADMPEQTIDDAVQKGNEIMDSVTEERATSSTVSLHTLENEFSEHLSQELDSNFLFISLAAIMI